MLLRQGLHLKDAALTCGFQICMFIRITQGVYESTWIPRPLLMNQHTSGVGPRQTEFETSWVILILNRVDNVFFLGIGISF